MRGTGHGIHGNQQPPPIDSEPQGYEIRSAGRVLEMYGRVLRGSDGGDTFGPRDVSSPAPMFGDTAAQQCHTYVINDRWYVRYRSCSRAVRVVHGNPAAATARDQRIAEMFRRHLQGRLDDVPLWILPRVTGRAGVEVAEEAAALSTAEVEAKIRRAVRTW